MAINISDLFHAAASIGYSAPVTPGFVGNNGFTSAVNQGGPGDTTLTLDNAVDATARTIHVTPLGTTAVRAVVESLSDSTFRVRTFDAAGAAADVPFCVSVFRHSL